MIINKIKTYISDNPEAKIRQNFFDKFNLVLIGLITLVYTLAFTVHFDWKESAYMKMAVSEIVLFVVNTLVIGMFRQKGSLRAFLYVTLVFGFMNMFITLFSFDVSHNSAIANNSLAIVGTGKNFFITFRVAFNIGFVIANFLIIPMFTLITAISFIEALWIERTRKTGTRLFLFFFITFLMVIVMSSIMSIPKFIASDNDLFKVIWGGSQNVYFSPNDVSAGNISQLGWTINKLVINFSYLLWLPLLTKVNVLNKTELFPNYQFEFNMAVRISIIAKLADWGDSSHFGGAKGWSLATFIAIFIIFALLFALDAYIIVKTAMLNYKSSKDKGVWYVPYEAQLKKVEDPFVLGLQKFRKEKYGTNYKDRWIKGSIHLSKNWKNNTKKA